MKINNETITFLTDTFDEIITNYYNYQNGINIENVSESKDNVIRISYLEAISIVIDKFLNEEEIEVGSQYEQKLQDNLVALNEWFNNHEVNSEEIRKALLLLDIKGFKQVNFSLDLITPDAVGMILVHLVSAYCEQFEQLSIIDPNVGTGNLVALLNNFLSQEISFTGIDNHELLVKLTATKANLMEMSCNVFLQDALLGSFSNHDLLVSDVASYDYNISNYDSALTKAGISYFPYLLIEKYLEVPLPIKRQIYLIEGNFFEQVGGEYFKEYLKQKAIIRNLIVLPSSMFTKQEFTKGILIIEPLCEDNKNIKTGIYMLPSLKYQDEFTKVLNQIKTDLKN